MDLVKTLWRGEISLLKTFWLFGLCVNLLFSVGINYFLIINPQALSTSAGYISFWVLKAFTLIYFPFIYISIWRSANKYKGSTVWAMLAKLMVIIGWGHYIMGILSLFVDKSG